MSNYTPPTTPIGGPPQPFPPQQPYPPAPPQNKSKIWIWLLAGCGTFILVGVIAVVLGGYFVWNKAKQAGLDPALLEHNPALAVAKMMVATNPDVELVSADDSKGTLVIRDKKTGKTLTLDVDQAEKGKIVFRGEDGEEMTIDGNNQHKLGSVKVTTREGSATFEAGGGSANLPDWLPAYPGAREQANFSSQSNEGRGGSFTFTTDDSIDQVIRFYDDALKDAGLKVETHSLQMDGKLTFRTVNGEDEQKLRTAAIQVTGTEGKTQVTVVFTSK
jgi:hypothetical protein